MLIGKGGSGLREMQERTGVKVRHALPADQPVCVVSVVSSSYTRTPVRADACLVCVCVPSQAARTRVPAEARPGGVETAAVGGRAGGDKRRTALRHRRRGGNHPAHRSMVIDQIMRQRPTRTSTHLRYLRKSPGQARRPNLSSSRRSFSLM